MKVESIRHRQPVLTRERGLVGSTSSGQSTISRLAAEASKSLTPGSRPRIRFCEERNKFYGSCHQSRDACRPLWYSQEDMRSFKAETRIRVHKILHCANADQQDWMEMLEDAYEILVRAKSADDIQEALESSNNLSIDPNLVGMEKWVLRDVVFDKATRRKQLMMAIHRLCHNETFISRSQREKMQRKESRELSRPSRLFAYYVAMAAANAEH